MAGLMLKIEKKNYNMVLVYRSVEAPRSPYIAARSLGGPISRRLCRRVDREEFSSR
jgi:hypothetical protein